MKHKISRHSGYPDDAQYFKSTGRRYRCREVRAEEAKLHLGRDATKDEMANGVVILGNLSSGDGGYIRGFSRRPKDDAWKNSTDKELSDAMHALPQDDFTDDKGEAISIGEVHDKARDYLLREVVRQTQKGPKA